MKEYNFSSVKGKNLWRILLTALLLFSVTRNACCQTGNIQSNPIVAGSFSAAFSYSNSQNTNNFTNNYSGKSTNDVYYRFTLSKKMEITMSHCGSTLSDTYLSLLDASGNQIAYNDDYYGTEQCSNTYNSYLKKELDAGTYYVVSEGYSQNGVILTQISGTVVYVQGDSFQDPIIAGVFNGDFQYSNSQNTANFTNQHTTRNPNDVFYKFTIGKKMFITMTHCGSTLSDTYMHLLDASGNVIVSNDDYSGDGACQESTLHSFIQRTLDAGTYYVVSEGFSGSGLITTNITGNASEEFDYPDIPNTYSTEPVVVGSMGGAFSVSATGGAAYSIPIAVPQGVGGMQPSLAIVYNSQSGNGMLGWGCNLSGLSAITRAPKNVYHDGAAKGLTHQADEAYYLDGQRLILSSGSAGQSDAVYYPESDPFTKITVKTTSSNNWFEVQSSNGLKYCYGSASSGRQSYTFNSATRIHAWYLDYVEDPLGNYMEYSYNNWSNFMYPDKITYGDNKNQTNGLQNTVSFSYDYRSNDSQTFVIDENVKAYLSYRLKSITTKTGNSTYRVYDLQYDITSDGGSTKFSRLTSVTEKNGAGESMKPVKLNWAYLPAFSQSYQTTSVRATYVPLGIYGNTVDYVDQSYIAADVNGDGLDDLIGIFPYYAYAYYQNSGNYGGFPTNIAFVNYASLNSFGNVQFTTGAWYDIGASFVIGNWSERKESPSVLDFNGDGVND